MVYADWLEQHGEILRAKFVRGEVAGEAAGTPAWRAITSRVKLVCDKPACPGTWDRLHPTEEALVRSCTTCANVGVYCTVPRQATDAIETRLVVAVDADPAKQAEFEKAIDYGRHPYKYRTMNPPPPGYVMPAPPPPLQRARNVLKRR